MVRFLFILLCSWNISFLSVAQLPVVAGKVNPANVGNFYGKIIDAVSLKPIEGASVQLLQNKSDSGAKKRKEQILTTQITDKKGEFTIEGIPVTGSFTLQISSIGYKSYIEKVSFDQAVIKDLGNIKLIADPRQLENITVNTSKPLLEMYLDKKVYNAEKDITSTGGTAVDVVKNIPSVNVDIDGKVTMRNASPQIFVDGRPSSLSLDQIPADQVATVEIITNPSAKYDAGAGGSGILNIILKKNRKAGYNGNARTSIDSYGRPGGGGDINFKQNKINFFAAAQIISRKSISTVSSSRKDFLGANTAIILQENAPTTKGYFAFGRMGADFLVSNRTTLTLSTNLVSGKFSTNDYLTVNRDTIKPPTISKESAVRNIAADLSFKNAGGSLGIKHNFVQSGKEWTADVNYNESHSTNTSNYNNQFFDGFGNPKPSPSTDRATGGGNTKFYTLQTDFVNPITKTSKAEMGIRVAGRAYTSWNDNYVQNPVTKEYILIAATGVRYNFDDIVIAGYSTYSRQFKKISIQLGLRAESSQYKGFLITKNQRFVTEYPISLFPSFFLTKKIDTKQDVQFNYSRKINRPGFFQLLPFVDFSDSLNLSIGNPELKPEFTQLSEISYSNSYKPGHSFLTSLYGKYTKNLITRYQYKTPNTDPSKPDSVLFNSYANADESYTIGLELTTKNKVNKWWDITGNLNLFDVTLHAANINNSSDSHLFSWFAKLNNSFKLAKNYSIQFTSDYQAKTILPVNSGRSQGGGFAGGGNLFGSTQNIAQGYIEPVYGADIAVKKDFLKNKAASLTLQINDIFRTRVYATHSSTPYFVQDNHRRRDPQLFRLNFSWRFGKIDVALFKRKNMKSEMDNLQNIQQGTGQ